MLEPNTNSSTRVAVFASSPDQSQHLQSMLENNGLNVLISENSGDKFLSALDQNTVDVLLIDLSDDEDEDLDFLDTISEKYDTPILFNDSGAEGVSLSASTDIWAKKLAAKLTEMASESSKPAAAPVNEAPFPQVKIKPVAPQPVSDNPFASDLAKETTETATQPASEQPVTSPGELNVWVLGASLGGPQAVRQFLSAVKADLPVVFILAQHIGANHVSLLAEQLDRVTEFTVLPGRTGHKLKHGEVILTPADKQLAITDDGYVALTQAPPATIYSPSIDNVMVEVARCYGKKAGTIVFSGMGDDGARGCEAIAEAGGVVWAQDIASCVVSSMPDQARKTGKVSYSANPEQLSQHLYEYYMNS
ncbi:chemotaxis protein CheB [Kaarinaea lacus]